MLSNKVAIGHKWLVNMSNSNSKIMLDFGKIISRV